LLFLSGKGREMGREANLHRTRPGTQLRRALVELVVEWADDDDLQPLLASSNVHHVIDLRPWVVTKVLANPLRGEQLLIRAMASDTSPEEFVNFLGMTFQWIEEQAASRDEADATIDRFCRGLPNIRWSRGAGGRFMIRVVPPAVVRPVCIGQRLRERVSDAVIRNIVDRYYRECPSGGVTYARVWLTKNHPLEIIAETRYVNVERTELSTVCGLRSEWRELAGEDPVWREKPQRTN
jgi:hypothetical protein